eukprot:1213754-Pleurochrysis_carterae.AAC.2
MTVDWLKYETSRGASTKINWLADETERRRSRVRENNKCNDCCPRRLLGARNKSRGDEVRRG